MLFVDAVAFVNWATKHSNEVGVSGLLVLAQFLSSEWKRVRQAALGEDIAFRKVMNDLCVFLLAMIGR